MKSFLTGLSLFSLAMMRPAFAQVTPIDKEAFLNDTSAINASLLVNMNLVFSHAKHGSKFPGRFISTLPSGQKLDEPVQLEVRGHFRQGFCYVPPLKIKFNYKDSGMLSSLKSLKMVSQCRLGNDNEQNLLKEYVVYKIYNLICPMSFRTRLLYLTFQDSIGKKKPIAEHAFLIEDVADLARRNSCKVWKGGKVNTEQSDRRQMTVVALFQFMIGNTDWAVSVDHNTRLIQPLKDSLARPYVIPYDFDYSGLVNTYYAIPDDKLEIEKVTERLYRGYPRNMDELEEVLDTFRARKKDIYALINNFSLLTPKNRENMVDYLEGFYEVISNKVSVKNLFIDNARKN